MTPTEWNPFLIALCAVCGTIMVVAGVWAMVEITKWKYK